MTTRPLQRTEAQICLVCDRLITRAHGVVVPIGRGKVDHHPGLPSRRYHVHGVPLWWAPRSSRGHLSRLTAEFLVAEYSMGQIVGAGDDSDLHMVVGFLADAHTDTARKVAFELFRRVADRGLHDRSAL